MQGVAYVRFGLLGEDGAKTFLRGLENQTKVGGRVGVWGRGGECWGGEEGVGEGRRVSGWGGGRQISPQALFSFSLQLVDGQCHISLSKAEFQGSLEKLQVNIADLPGLRLYVAAAIIESPGERPP